MRVGISILSGGGANRPPFWMSPDYLALPALEGIASGPAAICDFLQSRHALHPLAASDIPSAPRSALEASTMKSFADMISFARPGAASYIDAGGSLQIAAADVPRLGYTNGRPGLLLEGPATNLLANSVAGWTAVSGEVTVDTGLDAPDGSPTARRVSAVTGTLRRYTHPCPALTEGRAYTITVWIRLVAGAAALYNPMSASLVPLDDQLQPGKWVRITVTDTAEASPGSQIQIRLADDAVIDVWGAQLETGSFASSYIPTAGSAITRPADKAQLAEPVVDLLRGGEVSLLLQAQLAAPTENGRLVALDDKWLMGQQGSGGNRLNAYNGAHATIVNLPSGTTLDGFGAIVAIDSDGTRLTANGSAPAVHPDATKSSYGVTAAAYLGRHATSSSYFSPGWYYQFVVWPFRMTDADLQAKAVPHA